MFSMESPLTQFFDVDGSPLRGGHIFVGQSGQNPETNQITAFWDENATQPVAQPIKTINGYPSRYGTPSPVYVAGDYSLTVRNERGELVIYAPYASDTNAGIAVTKSLANTTNNNQGAGQVGFSKNIQYPSGTVGYAIQTFSWSDLYGSKPTTVAGYGITDAVSTSMLSQAISDAMPVGAMISWPTETPPNNKWLHSNGSSYPRAGVYSELYAVIGTRYGYQSSETFMIPDWRGIHPRFWSDSVTDRDPDRDSRQSWFPGSASGNHVGSYQWWQIQSHRHAIRQGSNIQGGPFFQPNDSTAGNQSFSESTGGNQTNGLNMYAMCMIKAIK